MGKREKGEERGKKKAQGQERRGRKGRLTKTLMRSWNLEQGRRPPKTGFFSMTRHGVM